ncbi:sigma 54-interacting transcriptional regulator [Nitrospirillum sp. BR 11163]|uniref:sigma 54-interacting transcriptional regulator n=1 Tax=Nitrospirillum sp. BR 11163 TaxID=3104323 RepID=UPI002AFDE2D5|nr:sigma 54-interacting transcriptional regulator [Nitrospirillum sp. BR 11163]MEA1676283.1 sigma 54-interacting transcriptional regulator [Nitrospirillum sp. BR 11163]
MQQDWQDATVSPGQCRAPSGARGDHTVACLGIVWHPNPALVGMIAPLSFGDGAFAVNRFEPVFRTVHNRGQGTLEDRHVSRRPMLIRRCGGRTFEIVPPASPMTVSVNGHPITEPVTVSLDELGADILVCLSERIILSIFEASLPLQVGAEKHGLIGISRGLQAAWALICQAAPTQLPVFLSGATGTGKELAAAAIHALSDRSGQKLHAVNMATLSPTLAHAELFGAAAGAYTGSTRERPGLFALAHGATLFMDEIGDTPKEVQPMLLRALECGEYRRLGDAGTRTANVRVISATDRSLDGADFNQPLRRRLEGVVVHLPALRERRVDIGPLLRHFLTREEPQLGPFEPGTLSAARVMPLLLHSWPGNVRELLGVARQIRLGVDVTLPRAAGAADRRQMAPSAMSAEDQRRRDPATVGDAELVEALDAAGWNIKAAAAILNVSRTSLYRLMERSPALQDAGDIPRERIHEVMRRHPGDVEAWARDLQLPKDSLKRHLRRIGVAS